MTLLHLAMTPILLIGLLTVYSWLLPLKPPADESNRFNRVRLWWFTVKCPEMFAEHYTWMRNDERDILNGDTQDSKWG